MDSVKISKMLCLGVLCLLGALPSPAVQAQGLIRTEANSETRQPVDEVFMVQMKVEDLPAEIAALDPRTPYIRPNAKYEITVGLLNDNVQGKDYLKGDDRGLTHGFHVKLNRHTQSGMMLTLEYRENLFTKDEGPSQMMDDGRKTWTQRTQTEKVLRLLVDSSTKGETFFLKAGVGWMRLDPTGKSLSARSQMEWHRLISANRRLQNLPGEVNKSGLFAEAHVGAQTSGNMGPFSTHAQASFGRVQNHISSASYWSVDTQAALRYTYESGRATQVKMGVENRVHSNGVETKISAALEMVGKEFTCGIGVSQTRGDIMNYQGYDLPNKRKGRMDMIQEVYCSRRF